jgi:hypothetical protein
LRRTYEAICLLDVADPSGLWDKLSAYVEAGKGLAIVPGGEDWQPSRQSYSLPAARRLLGVQFIEPENRLDKPDVSWKELTADVDKTALHPIVRRFRDAQDEGRFTEETLPRVRHYWKLRPDGDKARVLAAYTDDDGSPALIERQHGKGHVLIFSTSMDNHLVKNQHANNFFTPGSWFGLGLVLFSAGYLAGDAETPQFNFVCGQAVTVPVPATPTALFTLFGPPEVRSITVPRAKGENEVRVPQAVVPGNYRLYDPSVGDSEKAVPVAAFSVNVPPEESQLERVPVEQIEALLGPNSVLTVERGVPLPDAIQGHWLQPLELFPWLMILVLLVLAVENLLANKFYRRGAQEQTDGAKPLIAVEAKPHPVAARELALKE